jgi:hypothetical protein
VAYGLLVLSLSACSQACAKTAIGADVAWLVRPVYPVFAWIPLNIGIDVTILGVDKRRAAGSIVEAASMARFSAESTAWKGAWRIEGYGVWASFGTTGELPHLSVTSTSSMGKAASDTGSRRLYDRRRRCVNYDITIEDSRHFSRKPAWTRSSASAGTVSREGRIRRSMAADSAPARRRSRRLRPCQ